MLQPVGRGRAQMNAEDLNMIGGQMKLKHGEITVQILHAFYKVVYPQLGYGFLEKVYENALAIALNGMGRSGYCLTLDPSPNSSAKPLTILARL